MLPGLSLTDSCLRISRGDWSAPDPRDHHFGWRPAAGATRREGVTVTVLPLRPRGHQAARYGAHLSPSLRAPARHQTHLDSITSLITFPKYTVEIGSQHTLRLESLKRVFQPLHKFLVKLTNYIFGKSVRTSTLSMAQVIFPTIVYRQIISLIIHCVTIPVGQKFTYTKLTVALKIPENDVMALEASDRLIDII